jgi:EpsD family peptidyl-prolyl cis-trans isomerase
MQLVKMLLLSVALASCGDEKGGAVGITQAAAKVNKEEITVHQINGLLAQQRGGTAAERTELAERRALERLIDQELAMQRAVELRLDRDPRVMQAVEAARREILARSYIERIGEAVAKPTDAEVRKFYDDNPALFKDRRVFQLAEVSVQAAAEQLPDVRSRLQATKGMAEFVESMKAGGFKLAVNQTVRAAEQVPLALLPDLSSLKEGQAILTPTAFGASVVFLTSSRPQPVDSVRAAPAIEQFVINERRRRLVGEDMKALRAAAKIEYVGRYANLAPLPAEQPSIADAGAAPALQVLPAVPSTASSSAVDGSTISRGLGLK